ncbi:MAG TPA: AmmeMemoRadiSam system protein A [Gammaproteobacteria bacterium]|nr:AmmeMemoRadiSam system protein A [Gammaproteobacteria bacterium]
MNSYSDTSPGPSNTEAGSDTLSAEERAILLETARRSILHGLERGRPLPIDLSRYPESLRVKRATFVTLHIHGHLRGCIGTLEAVRPLVEDVASNAWAAAFSDPRFPPLARSELDSIQIEISVLSPPQPMAFHSEADLIRQIRPGMDGLILEERGHRGTFLPSVWESLPEPGDFLRHLKQKAGLPPDYWSDTIKVYRYTTESFR